MSGQPPAMNYTDSIHLTPYQLPQTDCQKFPRYESLFPDKSQDSEDISCYQDYSMSQPKNQQNRNVNTKCLPAEVLPEILDSTGDRIPLPDLHEALTEAYKVLHRLNTERAKAALDVAKEAMNSQARRAEACKRKYPQNMPARIVPEQINPDRAYRFPDVPVQSLRDSGNRKCPQQMPEQRVPRSPDRQIQPQRVEACCRNCPQQMPARNQPEQRVLDQAQRSAVQPQRIEACSTDFPQQKAPGRAYRSPDRQIPPQRVEACSRNFPPQMAARLAPEQTVPGRAYRSPDRQVQSQRVENCRRDFPQQMTAPEQRIPDRMQRSPDRQVQPQRVEACNRSYSQQLPTIVLSEPMIPNQASVSPPRTVDKYHLQVPAISTKKRPSQSSKKPCQRVPSSGTVRAQTTTSMLREGTAHGKGGKCQCANVDKKGTMVPERAQRAMDQKVQPQRAELCNRNYNQQAPQRSVPEQRPPPLSNDGCQCMLSDDTDMFPIRAQRSPDRQDQLPRGEGCNCSRNYSQQMPARVASKQSIPDRVQRSPDRQVQPQNYPQQIPTIVVSDPMVSDQDQFVPSFKDLPRRYGASDKNYLQVPPPCLSAKMQSQISTDTCQSIPSDDPGVLHTDTDTSTEGPITMNYKEFMRKHLERRAREMSPKSSTLVCRQEEEYIKFREKRQLSTGSPCSDSDREKSEMASKRLRAATPQARARSCPAPNDRNAQQPAMQRYKTVPENVCAGSSKSASDVRRPEELQPGVAYIGAARDRNSDRASRIPYENINRVAQRATDPGCRPFRDASSRARPGAPSYPPTAPECRVTDESIQQAACAKPEQPGSVFRDLSPGQPRTPLGCSCSPNASQSAPSTDDNNFHSFGSSNAPFDGTMEDIFSNNNSNVCNCHREGAFTRQQGFSNVGNEFRNLDQTTMLETSGTQADGQPRASLFRCLAQKLSSTYDFISGLVAPQRSSEDVRQQTTCSQMRAIGPPPPSSPSTQPSFSQSCARAQAQAMPGQEIPASVQECKNAKKCGRVQFDESEDEARDARLAVIRKTEIEQLVKDTYCPGLIQETVDGSQNFNSQSFTITFGPDSNEQRRRGGPPCEDPMTLLEAFSKRLDIDKENMSKNLTLDATNESVDMLINQYFANQNPSDLNRAIKCFFLSERLEQTDREEQSKGSLDADVQRWATIFPNKANEQMIAYTGHTKPIPA